MHRLVTINSTYRGRPLILHCDYVTPDAKLADLVPVAYCLTDAFYESCAAELQAAGQPLACKKGCSACCNQLVLLTVPEVFHVVAQLHALPDEARMRIGESYRALEEALDGEGMTDRLMNPEFREEFPHLPVAVDYFRAHHPCPFLHEQLCAIYNARPIGCRTHAVSSDPAFCDEPYRNHEEVQKLSLPVPTTALANLTAELMEDEAVLVPLPLALRWWRDNDAFTERTWLADELLSHLLSRLGKPR